jgi:hypothetical protein
MYAGGDAMTIDMATGTASRPPRSASSGRRRASANRERFAKLAFGRDGLFGGE